MKHKGHSIVICGYISSDATEVSAEMDEKYNQVNFDPRLSGQEIKNWLGLKVQSKTLQKTYEVTRTGPKSRDALIVWWTVKR